jgi:diguanylate cyclase (GGDEF)-like protein/PAS domain S-box-containing protein
MLSQGFFTPDMIDLFYLAGACLILLVALLWAWNRRAQKSELDSELPQPNNSQTQILIESTFGATGDTFFYSLVRELAQFLAIDALLLASCEDEEQEGVYRSLAYWCDDSYIMNQTVSLLHSPCEDIDGLCYLEASAGELYPQSSLLNEQFSVVGFFAIKLLNSSGKPVGLLAGMHRSALRMGKREVDIIKLFSARAAAELERKLAVSETLTEKERAQITLHSIGDGVITTDGTGCIDYMNPVAETLTGWRYHQVMGMSLGAVFHLEDDNTGEVIPDPALHCLAEKRVIRPKTDNVLISRNGDRISIQGTAAPMMNTRGDSIGVVLVFKDVTVLHRLQKKMVHQATHDPLTGLVNRSEFEQRLDKALQSAKAFENTHALLYLDLDQFKVVNDAAGHVAGDELLKQVCSLLANQLRGRDTLGRLGGDEFSVLLENCPSSKAIKVANILIDMIREYRFLWEDKTYQVGVSIGIVPITADSSSTTELMVQADQACYSAKDLGRGRAHVYDRKDAELAKQHSQILQVSDLREAIENQQFELLYQPIISLNPEQTRVHTRAEVLLRMLDHSGNHILPGAFLPAADRFGLTSRIDRWVIEKVFNDYAHLFMQNPNLVLNLNLSATSVADESLCDYIIEMFDRSVVLPEQICFEVKETLLNSNLSAISVLVERLREIGCSFALDDFGSGLANFAFLKNLAIDFIKIDGNIVNEMNDDKVYQGMVESVNSMAHLLGIKTIAEYADSSLVIQNLKSLGVDYAQGYYLGIPASMDELGGVNKSGREILGTPVN